MANGKPLPSPPMAYYDFYKTNGSDSVTMPHGASMTRQEFAEECDINSIMKRYDVAGTGPNFLPRDPNAVPMYIDFAETPQTLMEFMELQQNAERAFMSLPAVVRKEMDNDPINFVTYASDPNNLEQMREWGLAPPAKPQAAPPVSPQAPAAAAPPAGDKPAGGAPAPVQGAPTHGST